MCVPSCFHRVRLFATPRTAARQASLSMGTLQARVLEWLAASSSRESSRPRGQTHSLKSPALAGRLFTTSTTWMFRSSRRVPRLLETALWVLVPWLLLEAPTSVCSLDLLFPGPQHSARTQDGGDPEMPARNGGPFPPPPPLLPEPAPRARGGDSPTPRPFILNANIWMQIDSRLLYPLSSQTRSKVTCLSS